MKTYRRRQRVGGFSLIEVLIALVVLAFGLLGLALLQTVNLKYTQSANQRTQAVNLAGQLLDMMRSNRSELAAYSMTPANFAGVVPPVSGCASTTLMGASGNVPRWQCEVRETLGAQATANVGIDAPTRTVTVTVTWVEQNASPLAGEGEIQLRSVL